MLVVQATCQPEERAKQGVERKMDELNKVFPTIVKSKHTMNVSLMDSPVNIT